MPKKGASYNLVKAEIEFDHTVSDLNMLWATSDLEFSTMPNPRLYRLQWSLSP